MVPAGIYLTGGIRLCSNVTLYLESGAILKGSNNPEDYFAWKNDEIEPISFTMNNVNIEAKKGFEDIILMEAENYSDINLNNVTVNGYSNPKILDFSMKKINITNSTEKIEAK